MEKAKCSVCVTGAAGYIGSALVKRLLEKGYTVHGTLRNLGDQSKVQLLKSFPHADTRLVLFQADMYNPDEFEQAIHGCTFVFHVATPLQHTDGLRFKSTTEAAISATNSIAVACIKSGTVRRLIYTATVGSASPMKDDGTGFRDSMDETCWTPLNLSFPYSDDYVKDYTESKTLSEKQLLRYGSSANDGGLEVVSLACGLVGGDTVLSYTPGSVSAVISQLTNNASYYKMLRFLEEMLGKIPIVHINDVCEAHIFCMENPSISGRFLCAGAYVSSAEIASCYQLYYPEFQVKQEYLDGPKREIKWGSTRLIDKGFEYKCDLKMIIDDSVRCARIRDPVSHAMEKESKVCVTGAASFLGSWLVKTLLEKGYVVHATARNLRDPHKVGLLKSLPNAETKLRLYEADSYNPNAFKHAIEGCEYVVHMATPLLHQPLGSQFKNTSEAAVAGVKIILESCIRSGTVKRLIYTASVTAATPMKENGKGFKDQMDESCWTFQEISLPYSNEALLAYTYSKTLSEKELLRYNGELEVVSLVCGLVGGETLLSSMPESMGVLISQATKNKRRYHVLRFLEELLGKVPILHIKDVCDAHIFCLEKPSIRGRFLCASAYLSSADIAAHCRKHYPDIDIPDEFVENLGREILWGSSKLKEVGFDYKCDVKRILEDSINCGLRLGECGLLFPAAH